MRIVMMTVGSSGDVHPYVGLGRALAARGHEVHVIANEAFRAFVEAAGLGFHGVGSAEAYREAKEDPELWHPRRGLRTISEKALAPYLRPAYEACRALVVPDETVILASTLAFAAHVAADATGVPLVVAQLAPSMFPSVHRPPVYAGLPLPDWMPKPVKRVLLGLALRVADHSIRGPIDALRSELGLPRVKRYFADWVNRADLLLGLFPPWFAPAQPDWPPGLLLVGFPLHDGGAQAEVLEPELEGWLDAGPPPVVVTAGSAHLFGAEYYHAAIEATAALDRRALLITQRPEVLPAPLPAHVRHESYAPFSGLFPKACAVVHHGGIGTCARALDAGLPSLTAPMAFDQFDNASRLEDLGVGATLPMKRVTARRMRERLEQILAPGVTSRAKQLPQTNDCELDVARTAAAFEALLA